MDKTDLKLFLIESKTIGIPELKRFEALDFCLSKLEKSRNRITSFIFVLMFVLIYFKYIPFFSISKIPPALISSIILFFAPCVILLWLLMTYLFLNPRKRYQKYLNEYVAKNNIQLELPFLTSGKP